MNWLHHCKWLHFGRGSQFRILKGLKLVLEKLQTNFFSWKKTNIDVLNHDEKTFDYGEIVFVSEVLLCLRCACVDRPPAV